MTNAGRTEVGHERRGHQPLPDRGLVQARLDQHRVNHRETRRREGDARDLRLPVVPAEPVVREQADDDERCPERDEPERQGRLPLALELRHVDLGTGQERENDAGERADEVEPVRDRDVESVADHHAREQLDQRDRESELDRDRRGEKDCCGEYGCDRDAAQALPPAKRTSGGRGHQRHQSRFGASLITLAALEL
jgi:hypothetical protein